MRPRCGGKKCSRSIQIFGAPDDQQRKFYTALYHAFIQPRDRTGDNPRWTSTAPFWDDQYTLWDMWRTLYPLMAIVDPQMLQSVVNSFIDRHRHDGYAATAFIQGQEFDVGQGGDEVDNVIADASVKQIPGVDWQEAYAVLKSNADQGANEKLSGKRLGERRRFAPRSSPNEIRQRHARVRL